MDNMEESKCVKIAGNNKSGDDYVWTTIIDKDGIHDAECICMRETITR